jgi:hypothetical protein
MDEVQVAYHVSSFWRMFKFGSTCYVLAFAAFSVDDKRVKVKSVDAIAPTPAVFADTRSYSFVAFTRAEFDEVARQFKDKYSEQIGDRAIEFVAQKVKSSHQGSHAKYYAAGEKQEGSLELYHPGLAYACFTLFSESSDQEESILVQYETGSNLYKGLLHRVRCFARFRNFRDMFERQVKLNAAENNENVDETRKKLASFEEEFFSLLTLLCCDRHVEYNETNASASNALKTVLVRFGFCCREKPTTVSKSETIYLSCPLVRTHFNNEVFQMTWVREKPLAYQETSLLDYVISVVSNFSPKSLSENYQRNKKDKKLYEKGFDFEFGIVASRDDKAVLDPQHYFYDRRGIKGKVDYYLNGDKNIGVELLVDWSDIVDHLERIEYKYCELLEYLTVHLHEGKLPDKEAIADLIATLKRMDYLGMLLIVNFPINEELGKVDFNRAIFYTPEESGTLK